jgi:hypothetical protein
MKLAMSTILEEDPISLSYQERTFTIRPSITEVVRESTMEESAFPLKSMDTRGSSE